MLRAALRQGFERVDNVFDAAFGGNANPFHQLGALGWFFYWIVAATGVYLFVFFDTGVTDAYASVERLTHAQWYAGGIVRSLHRYASDALVIVVIAHLLREYAMDRLRGRRWFAWLTGVPLLWFLYASGISGYWLVWDTLAQYIAIQTSQWLDALPFFGTPVARNFLNGDALSGRFFTLMVFIHIAVPLVMLLVMWVHIQRHAAARVNPPRALAAGSLVALVALSLLHPAVSQPPADLDTVVAQVDLDWFYLSVYPLLDVVPGGVLWIAVAALTVLLALMPWAPPQTPRPAARVDLANCNGCARCYDDCPYSAIEMAPRSDGLRYSREAVVDADLCTSCGICAGACPTASPFRRATQLVAGIELPDLPMADLRERVLAACQNLQGGERIVVFDCGQGAPLEVSDPAGTAVIDLPCVAALPPPFIDMLLSRSLADGVMLAACRDGDCHHRLGLRWAELRVARERDPYLRARVPDARVLISRAGRAQPRRRERDLARLREQVRRAASQVQQ